MAAVVRWALPLATIAVGLVVALTVRELVGEAIVGAGVCVAVAAHLFRFGLSSQDDRDREEAARAYFDEHGRWPDDDAAAPR